MSQSDIITAMTSVRGYFQDAITDALTRQDLQPQSATAVYLVDLLCQYAKINEEEEGLSLAQMLVRAHRSLPGQSVPQLRKVGDRSLYVAGYFSDSLRRLQLDKDYLTLLGTTAYHRLSRLLHEAGGRTKLVDVFSELGKEFNSFVEVLDHVKHFSDSADTASQIAALYQKWLETGCEAVAKQLRATGVVLPKKDGGTQ